MNTSQWMRLAPLLLALLVALLLASGLLFPAQKTTTTAPMVGNMLPSFSVPKLDDPTQMFLPTQWKEQVAVVNIFASWCQPCKVEHPVLMKLAKTKSVRLFGIAWKDSPENIQRYLAENGNPYESVGVDARGLLTLIFGITGLPETYIIDKNGVVRWKYSGPMTAALINAEMIPMINTLNAEAVRVGEVIRGNTPADIYQKAREAAPEQEKSE